MTWMSWIIETMVLEVPSSSLLMKLNWMDWRTCQKGESFYRDTWTGWKSDQARAVWSLTKTSERFDTRDDTTNESSTGEDLCGWGAPLLKGTSGSWWATSRTWVSGMSLKQQTRSWAASTGPLLADIDMWWSHSTQTLSGHTWSTVSSSGPHNSTKIQTD